MKHLSTIANNNDVFMDTKGYAWIQLKEMRGARHRIVARKVSSKQFSNYSVDTVRINNETYLIDSQITVRF